MVEWSKTWDLSLLNFPITQVARVRTPLLSSFFFPTHPCPWRSKKNIALPMQLYRKQMREWEWDKQIQNKTRVTKNLHGLSRLLLNHRRRRRESSSAKNQHWTDPPR
jgi:hypothetical protein